MSEDNIKTDQIMSLNDWMNKFAGVDMWNGETVDKDFSEDFPYFQVDLYSAYQKNGLQGTREVLTFYKRLKDKSREVLMHEDDVRGLGEYPPNVKEVRVDEEGSMRSGYERLWRSGLFKYPGGIGRECLWHKHDGFGKESGTVEFWLYKGKG